MQITNPYCAFYISLYYIIIIISLLQEDKRLTHLVNSSWKTSWSIISQQMPDRTAKQCRERYVNNLDPDRKKGAWTEEEDEIIMKLQAELGTQWSKISAGESPSFPHMFCILYVFCVQLIHSHNHNISYTCNSIMTFFH